MKTIIVYDSFFGNTKKVAEALAVELGGEAIEVDKAKTIDLAKVDFLIVGSPIRGWRPSEKTIAFLSGLAKDSLKGISATAFDTRVKLFIHGDAKEKIAKMLKRAGANITIKPEAFYVKGSEGPLLNQEIEKAGNWAKKITKTIER